MQFRKKLCDNSQIYIFFETEEHADAPRGDKNIYTGSLIFSLKYDKMI